MHPSGCFGPACYRGDSFGGSYGIGPAESLSDSISWVGGPLSVLSASLSAGSAGSDSGRCSDPCDDYDHLRSYPGFGPADCAARGSSLEASALDMAPWQGLFPSVYPTHSAPAPVGYGPVSQAWSFTEHDIREIIRAVYEAGCTSALEVRQTLRAGAEARGMKRTKGARYSWSDGFLLAVDCAYVYLGPQFAQPRNILELVKRVLPHENCTRQNVESRLQKVRDAIRKDHGLGKNDALLPEYRPRGFDEEAYRRCCEVWDRASLPLRRWGKK